MPLLAATLGLTVPEYGYVLAVGISSTLVNFWHGYMVGQARKQAGVAYPAYYASNEEAEKDAAKKRFNCTQRAHGNYQETLPNFLVLLGIAGLRYPVYASITGVTWLVGRILYAQGYATGDPAARTRGVWSHFSELVLLGMSVWTSYKMVVGEV